VDRRYRPGQLGSGADRPAREIAVPPAMDAELVPFGDRAADERSAMPNSRAEHVERRPRTPLPEDGENRRRDGARTVVERQRNSGNVTRTVGDDEANYRSGVAITSRSSVSSRSVISSGG
jgi:hypothetical protein